MRSQGNMTQWAGNYPNRDILYEDIRQGRSFVALLDDRIVATFCFTEGPDPTYAVIEQGSWLHEEPYHVIHRMACIERNRGIASACMAWCLGTRPPCAGRYPPRQPPPCNSCWPSSASRPGASSTSPTARNASPVER